MIALSALHYYPLKSCKGLALEQATLDQRGLVHDREFMVVDEAGAFLTQRELPRLALITPTMSDGLLTLSAPGTAPLTFHYGNDGPRLEAAIWRDTVVAVDQGEAASTWLTGFLQTTPVRLMRLADEFTRQVNQQYAPRTTDQVGFADGFPLLLISEASLADLNARLEKPLPMNRFRPNLVVAGCGPYAEDSWKQIRIGGLVFDIVKPCARCVTTTTNQDTAERGKEPLRTLATYRHVPHRGAMFGQNVVHASTGMIRVGDEVEVMA